MVILPKTFLLSYPYNKYCIFHFSMYIIWYDGSLVQQTAITDCQHTIFTCRRKKRVERVSQHVVKDPEFECASVASKQSLSKKYIDFRGQILTFSVFE